MTEVDRSAHRVCGWPDWLRQPHTKWSRHKKWRAIARPSLKQLLSAQICMRKVRLLGLAADTVGILRDVLVLSMHAHAPAWGSRACTWASNQRRQSELHRQEPLEFSSPAIPDALVLWSLLWPGLWPSLGLMASGNNFDRRQPRSWSSHKKTIYHLCRSHTSHITTHRPKAKPHRPEHISLRARAAGRFQRRHHVKLYLSAGEAVVYHASDTAAHCDLHLPTRLPKALRQATPESDRREHTTNPSSPNSLSKIPCAAF